MDHELAAAHEKSKPWYLVLEKSQDGPNKSKHLSHQINIWGCETKEKVGDIFAASAEGTQEAIGEMTVLNSTQDRQLELARLNMDAIAAMPNPKDRKEAKKARQIELIKHEFATLRTIKREKDTLLDAVLARSHARQVRTHNEFLQGAQFVQLLGQRLDMEAKKHIAASETRQQQRLSTGPGKMKVKTVSTKHRKNANGLGPETPSFVICNAGVTVVHREEPAVQPCWAVVEGEHTLRCLKREQPKDWWDPIESRVLNEKRKTKLMDVLEVVTEVAAGDFQASFQAKFDELAGKEPMTIAHRTKTVHANLVKIGLHSLAAAVETEIKIKKTIAVTQLICKSIKPFGMTYGQYYYEIHTHSRSNHWMIGFAKPPTTRENAERRKRELCFTSKDVISFGIAEDNHTWTNGKRSRGPEGLDEIRAASVIGVLVDLHMGRISVSADGETFIIFGNQALAFTLKERRSQAFNIKKQPLKPVFCLLGPKVKKVSAHQQQQNRPELKGFVRPQMSINLGKLPFVHAPPGILPACQDAPPHVKEKEEYMGIFDPPPAEGHNPRQMQELHKLLPGARARQDMEMLQAREKRFNGENAAFLQSLRTTKLQSWSRFPPQDILINQAVCTIQRVVRHRRRKRIIGMSMSRIRDSAVIIQRAMLRFMAKRRMQRQLAALPVQAVYRGFKARKTFKMMQTYKLNYKQLEDVTTKIQSVGRMVLAKNETRARSESLRRQVEQMRNHVIFVQRVRRWRVNKRYNKATKEQVRAATVLQKSFRAVRSRLHMSKTNPATFAVTQELTRRIRKNNEDNSSARQIQSWWRGRLARIYTKARKRMTLAHMVTLRDAYRRHKLRVSVSEHFEGEEALVIKILLDALNLGNLGINK